MIIHISKDGTGDFSTVQSALNTLPADNRENILIHIHRGVYREQITLKTPYVTFQGDGAHQTILTYHLSAREIMPDGEKRGTFRSYSAFIDTHDFTAKDLTFENSAGPGTSAGQALALYVDGDRICFENCRFLGNQDTLFTAPLPPKEIETNGFLGPKQLSPRISGRHYYKNCYIEGDVDFIFGGAAAYFDQCTFFSKNTGKEINGYVTAASTPEGQKYGYVMDHCSFHSNCPPKTVYLGRPWREYAKTVLIHCFLDEHICPQGWHDWGKEMAHKTVYYAEYQSYGPGASPDKRAAWSKQLSEEEAGQYSAARVLAGSDGWMGKN